MIALTGTAVVAAIVYTAGMALGYHLLWRFLDWVGGGR